MSEALHYYKHGKLIFSCVPNLAVEVAYLLNVAEGKGWNTVNRFHIGEILGDYCMGDLSVAEAVACLEELPDAL